jgi:PAS domain S-box-containing protein
MENILSSSVYLSTSSRIVHYSILFMGRHAMELSDIIDKVALQALMEDLTRLTGMVTAILDLKGNVLVATGWQPLCTKFHRVNPVTAGFCTESDLYLSKNMKRGEYVTYKCKNNLWDMVTPLYIGDQHFGNIFTGQFFYDDEVVDESVFAAQAEKYGFDREEYLAALRKVPRFSREKVTTLMDYLVKMTEVISKVSFSNLTLTRTSAERDALFDSLTKSEERLRLTLDAANDGIWDWNIPAGTVFFSPRWYTMIGYEPNELTGTYATWQSLLHPDDLGPAEQKIRDNLERNDEGYAAELRMRTKQGDWKWVLARGKVVERDAAGKPVRMVGTHTDISGQKYGQEELARKNEELVASYEQIAATEEELRENYDELAISQRSVQESERKFRNLYQYAQVGLFETSLKDGTVVACNERYATLAGYSSVEDATGKDIVHLYKNPDDRKEVSRILHEQGHIDNHILELKKHLTGLSFWVQFSARINRENDVAEGSIIDITERKQAESALSESEQRFRKVFEEGPMGMAMADFTNGRFFSVNKAFCDMLGYTEEELKQLTFADVTHPDYRAGDREVVKNMQEGQIQKHTTEKMYLTKSGEAVWCTRSLTKISSPDGTSSYALAMIENITERKRAELELLEAHHDLEKKVIERTRELSDANERLQELDKLKSLFIASMSHELRTPLNSIIGFTGIMVNGRAGEINPEQKKQLGMVQESARHLLALINDVIDISKIEAGVIEANVSTFDLAGILHEVQNTLGAAAAGQGLELTIEIPGPTPVTSDDRRIRQIILNLVSNAIKFTDEGRIDVAVQQKGDRIEVRVSDTGIGIGPEDLAHLFRPFVRVRVPGRLTEGTGLGLYLSKKIARFLGGDITAQSEPGKGSRFIFTFPVRYEEQEDV